MECKKINKIVAVFLVVATFALDQWSKAEVLGNPLLSGYTTIEITSFFNLVLVFNRGVSFGMFAGYNQPLLLIIFALIIISVLLVWLWRSKSVMVTTGIGLVVGGAAGNVVDRIRYGAVVDFLDFHLGELHWPAFNLADSFVFIGVVVLCVHSLFFEDRQSAKPNSSTQQ